MNAVRELATRLKTKGRQGESGIFLFVDLKMFLPQTCTDRTLVHIDENGSIKSKNKSDRRLELHWWLAAWDRYALAAHALGQMQFATAMEHKRVVLDVAALAGQESRRALLAVLYDEHVRKSWEEKTGPLGESFDLAKEASRMSDDILRWARADHDWMFRET
eukprot:8994338-Karenia_brevis.AAC.1